jgi:NAD(P)H-hydrate epimerase
VAAPERPANIVAGFLPDMITVPLAGNFVRKDHTEQIIDIAKNEKVTAIVVGGGMGKQVDTLEAEKMLHEAVDLPFVFDADSIHAIKYAQIILRPKDIVTPHAGEFVALFGIKPSENINERAQQVKQAAKQIGCVVLLKGWIDVVSDGNEIRLVKKAKQTVYMTKGGTGDVLAGIAGALLAQGMRNLDAAYYAATINGKAGEIVGAERGAGLLASDLLDAIPKALRKVTFKAPAAKKTVVLKKKPAAKSKPKKKK